MVNNLYPVDFFTVYKKSDIINRMGCLVSRDVQACNLYCK